MVSAGTYGYLTSAIIPVQGRESLSIANARQKRLNKSRFDFAVNEKFEKT